MIIDFHAHFDVADPELIKKFVKTYEQNDAIAILNGDLCGGWNYVPNAEVFRLCQHYPGVLYPMAYIDLPDKTPDLDQLNRFAEMGSCGFKFINPYFPYDDDRYMPVYERLEQLGLPALFHTGDINPIPRDAQLRRPNLLNMDPLRLDRLARSFPKLNLVIAHLGTTIWRVQAAEIVKTHPNLYADLAGCGNFAAVSPQELAQLLAPRFELCNCRKGFYHKLVFGSDSYISHPQVLINALQHYEEHIHRIGLPPEIRAEIMGRTVARWLNFKA